MNVSASTLRAWEGRFGYPHPRRSPGRHRMYAHAEVCALREALEQGLSISSAVSAAQEVTGMDAYALVNALELFRADKADQAMEGSLALRSLERTVEEVLLRALEVIRRRKGVDSAAWAFATRWSADWLVRAKRFGTSPQRRGSLLIGDACASPLDPDRPDVLALELCCARAGLEVLSLPVEAHVRLFDATEAITPDAVVIAGDVAPDDDVARWAYGVRECTGPLPFVLFRRTVGTLPGGLRRQVLARSPLTAGAELLALCANPGAAAAC